MKVNPGSFYVVVQDENGCSANSKFFSKQFNY